MAHRCSLGRTDLRPWSCLVPPVCCLQAARLPESGSEPQASEGSLQRLGELLLWHSGNTRGSCCGEPRDLGPEDKVPQSTAKGLPPIPVQDTYPVIPQMFMECLRGARDEII